MSPPPRRLSFAVGTSLLSASLSLGVAGCDDKEPTVNPAPEKLDEAGEDHVNVGPDEPEPKPEPKPEPEPIHVNEGPQPQPETPPEPTENVNVQPEPEPKRVNVRPD